MAKVLTTAIHDPHSVALYDTQTGVYEGIIYVTSGTIVGMPIVTPTTLTVQCLESGLMYMAIYELPSRVFVKKIVI